MDKYLIHKKLQYKVLAAEPAKTADGTEVPGQLLAQLQDPHTAQPFYLLVSQELMDIAGYTLMGKPDGNA